MDEPGASSAYDLLRSASRGLIGIDQRFMHALVDDPAKSVPDLLRFASEDHHDDPVDLEPELIAAFHYLKPPEALPYLIQTLRINGSDADSDLIQAVIEQGPAALEPLLALYDEMEEEESDEVAFTLAGLGIRDGRILRLLLDRLQYNATDGAMALAVYGDPAAIPEIQKILATVPEENADLRRDLSEAIQDLERRNVVHTNHEFHVFDRYPEEAGPDFDILTEEDRRELLSSATPSIRAQAARTFFEIEYGPQTSARLFAMARTDADTTVRARAWEALSGQDDPEIRKALRAVALGSGTHPEERAGALVALAAEGDVDPEIHHAIEALYEEPGLRAKALEAMWRTLDRSFAKYFPPHLEDSDSEILLQAIFGTGYLGIGTEAERVARYFRDDDLRVDALFAYALCVPSEISRGRIRGVLRKIDRAAGRLSHSETELVQTALDQRLMLHGLDPVFSDPEPVALPTTPTKVGRNDPCPCGSGKKYKKCCGA